MRMLAHIQAGVPMLALSPRDPYHSSASCSRIATATASSVRRTRQARAGAAGAGDFATLGLDHALAGEAVDGTPLLELLTVSPVLLHATSVTCSAAATVAAATTLSADTSELQVWDVAAAEDATELATLDTESVTGWPAAACDMALMHRALSVKVENASTMGGTPDTPAAHRTTHSAGSWYASV